jgi:ubiquinone/menaquinone biosynthesis C-methylase UbiE
MKETSKARAWREELGYFKKYIKGKGIDIGCGSDIITHPSIKSVIPYDLRQGNGELLKDIKKNNFDFVHSSHCLEHLENWENGIKNWIRVCRVGGYVVIAIPDQYLYEHNIFPSIYNKKHNWTFTIDPKAEDLGKTIYIKEYLKKNYKKLGVKIELIKLNDQNYNYNDKTSDQTLGNASAQIEIVLKKTKDL